MKIKNKDRQGIDPLKRIPRVTKKDIARGMGHPPITSTHVRFSPPPVPTHDSEERYIGTEAELKRLRAELQKFHTKVRELRAVVRSLKRIKIGSTARGTLSVKQDGSEPERLGLRKRETRQLAELGGTSPEIKPVTRRRSPH